MPRTLASGACSLGPEPLGVGVVGQGMVALAMLGAVAAGMDSLAREPGSIKGFMGVVMLARVVAPGEAGKPVGETGLGEVSGELEDSAEGSRR